MNRGTGLSSASPVPEASAPLLCDWSSQGRGGFYISGWDSGLLKMQTQAGRAGKEAVADVSLSSNCPIPPSGTALMHVHAKINWDIALG